MSRNIKGLIYGILAGVGLVLYFLLFYFLDKNMMMSLWVSWSSILILIVCAFITVYQQREANEGIITFKDGLKTGFLVTVIANLIFYAFFFIIVKSDADLVTILEQQSIDFYKKYGTKEQLEKIDQEMKDFKFGFSDLLLSLAKSTIGGFFIALLPAFIFKKLEIRRS